MDREAPKANAVNEKRTRVAVALLASGRVLLIHRWRQGDEYFVLPGGGVEPDESIDQAARREVREETTLDLKGPLTPLLDVESYDERHGITQRYIAFTADTPMTDVALGSHSPEAQRASESNRYELEWIELGRISALYLQPLEVKEALLGLGQ